MLIRPFFNAGSLDLGLEITTSGQWREESSSNLTQVQQDQADSRMWTYSTWVKRARLDKSGSLIDEYTSASDFEALNFSADDRLQFYNYTSAYYGRIWDMKFRDTSAWYHIVLRYDSRQSNGTFRVMLWVNGVLQPFENNSFTAITLDKQCRVNRAGLTRRIGFRGNESSYPSFYLAETNMVDGLALDADDFGYFNKIGVWVPKAYTGPYGHNGFYLKHNNATDINPDFTATLWTGSSSTVNVDTSIDADLLITKVRNASDNWWWCDSTDGFTTYMQSNQTVAKQSVTARLTDYSNNVMTITSGDKMFNLNGYTYMTYAFKQNPDWFGMVTWAGNSATVDRNIAHGMNGKPELVIVKTETKAGQPWYVSHEDLDADHYAYLHDTLAQLDGGTNGSGYITAQDHGPINITLSAGTSNSTVNVNETGHDYIAYMFKSHPGVCKVGTYSGINAGGNIIHCGFRPRIVISKRANGAGEWSVFDSRQAGYIENQLQFRMNAQDASTSSPSSTQITFLDDGFQWNTNDAALNGAAGNDYIYIAIAGEDDDAELTADKSAAGWTPTVFNAVTFQGNAGVNDIWCGFQPDMVWCKRRSAVRHHNLYDSERGVANYLYPNTTSAETNDATGMLSFNPDGFTLGIGNGDSNGANDPTVAWCFKKDPEFFDMVSYVGTGVNRTVSHNLTVVPELMIVKSRDTGTNHWAVYHKDMDGSNPADYYMILNGNNARVDAVQAWNDTLPTSSEFTVGTINETNKDTDNFIAYLFASKTGVSQVGSYSGTSAAGNTVSCGFRPSFLLIKDRGSTEQWYLLDTQRGGYNENNLRLHTNSDSAEATSSGNEVDFTDDGFVLQGTDFATNTSGRTYLYIAIGGEVNSAENGFTASALTRSIDTPTYNQPIWSQPDSENSPNIEEAGHSTSMSTGDFIRGSIATNKTGKWYFEIQAVTTSSSGNPLDFGISSVDDSASDANPTKLYRSSQIYMNNIATSSIVRVENNATVETQTGVALSATAGDILQCAYDADTGDVWFGKNNVWWDDALGTTGNPSTGANPCVTFSDSGHAMIPLVPNTNSVQGLRLVKTNELNYTPPTGFKTIEGKNLAAPSVREPGKFFNAVLWTGDGSNGSRAITGMGFQPDLVIMKLRDSTTQDHQWYDSERGVGSGKCLCSNTTAIEGTVNSFPDGDYGFISSLDSDGFTVDDGAVATTGGYVNFSGRNYIGWGFKKRAGFFDIVNYTGDGVASSSRPINHNLGVKPEMIITKKRNAVGTDFGWSVWHKDLSTTSHGIWLHLTNVENPTMWDGGGSHTSSVFYPPDLNYGNVNTATYVNYLFASLDGVSKCGLYTGNGSTDGPFIYTGFRPAFLLIKRIDGGVGNWDLIDGTRDTYNPAGRQLTANGSGTEPASVDHDVDLLSNGFKWRDSSFSVNNSSDTYIYLAIAESSFKYARAR